MAKREKKYPFQCTGCKEKVIKLSAGRAVVRGVVRKEVFRRCRLCEKAGRVTPGQKQFFVYVPEAGDRVEKLEEIIVANTTYL